MIKYTTLAALLLASVTACAQQQPPNQTPDPAYMQKIMGMLQQQRNDALDKEAIAEVKAGQLSEEVQRLRAQLAEKTKDDKPK